MQILIVEDSPRLNETLRVAFRKLGFNVEASEDGKEGYLLAISQHYDVIILDIMLPNMDGLSIVKNLRNRNIDTPILLLTARDEVDDRVTGLNIGADDYLCKPFALEELEARIYTLIRRSASSGSSCLSIDDVTLNLQLKEVSVCAKTINFTPIEYLLLEKLFLNMNKVVSYGHLEEQLCDRDTGLTRNAIEAHISSVRRKLREEGVEGLIRTKRNFGYFISEH